MNSVERVKQLCKEKKIPISRLEKDLGYSNGYIGQLRKGVFPSDRLQKIADYFGVSVDYLMTGQETEKSDIILTDKDEKDIQRRIERAIRDLEEQDALMFDGEPLDDATRAALMESLASSIRIAKIKAKQKYGRKKSKQIGDDNNNE